MFVPTLATDRRWHQRPGRPHRHGERRRPHAHLAACRARPAQLVHEPAERARRAAHAAQVLERPARTASSDTHRQRGLDQQAGRPARSPRTRRSRAALNDLPTNFRDHAQPDRPRALRRLPGVRSPGDRPGKSRTSPDAAPRQPTTPHRQPAEHPRRAPPSWPATTTLSDEMRARRPPSTGRRSTSAGARASCCRPTAPDAKMPTRATPVHRRAGRGQRQELRPFNPVATPPSRSCSTTRPSPATDLPAFEPPVEGRISGSCAERRSSPAPSPSATGTPRWLGHSRMIRSVERRLDEQRRRRRHHAARRPAAPGPHRDRPAARHAALAILFAWVVARSMARSLRELRHGALDRRPVRPAPGGRPAA